MSEAKQVTPDHRHQAIDLFNLVWTFLNKPDRTIAENDTMLHAAHASRYHWGEVGTEVNLARGEWQIARVYAILGRSEPALYHAGRCLAICQENNIGDWDLAFAYEAVTRAWAVAGDASEYARYDKLAREAAEQIVEAEDKKMVLADLANIKVK